MPRLSLKVTVAALALCLVSTLQVISHRENAEIPGLYKEDDLIVSIAGKNDFNEKVRNLGGDDEKVSIVQYYMATCPHCQNFAPYFRRLAGDIQRHWGNLMKTFVVNCNDEQNMPVCWVENTQLTVPQVRWYPSHLIQHKFKLYDLNQQTDRANETKIRRDHITLRHRTLDALRSEAYFRSILMTSNSTKLPYQWMLLNSLKGRGIEDELKRRSLNCLRSLGFEKDSKVMVSNIIVVDHYYSHITKTIVADWSNWTCLRQFEARDRKLTVVLLVHYMDRSEELDEIPVIWGESVPDDDRQRVPNLLAYQFHDDSKLDTKKRPFELVGLSPELICLCDQCEDDHEEKLKKKFEMRSSRCRTAKARHKLRTNCHRYSHRHSHRHSNRDISPSSIENPNFLPPNEYFVGEEDQRYLSNRIIRSWIKNITGCRTKEVEFEIPEGEIAGFRDGNPGELPPAAIIQDPMKIVDPKDEDMALVHLTDYYKTLALMVKKNILSRGQVDGYQLLANACWLDTLARYFPFQGGREATNSTTKGYLNNLRDLTLNLLNQQLKLSGSYRLTCNDSLTKHGDSDANKKLRNDMLDLKVDVDRIQDLQARIDDDHLFGLADHKHFSWTTCSGSSEYKRGYTCGVWLLFHTLLAHAAEEQKVRIHDKPKSNDAVYKWQVMNFGPNNASCSPQELESSFLRSTSDELYIDEPQWVLSAIVNYVRFYLGCTNCAAHFSCAIHLSRQKLFSNTRYHDHSLFLWELHNRVNIRTAKTNSEDPLHPKHVFPDYKACPKCYAEDPSEHIKTMSKYHPDKDFPEIVKNFEKIRFKRGEIKKFLSRRYYPSNLINNKIRIEDLWKEKIHWNLN